MHLSSSIMTGISLYLLVLLSFLSIFNGEDVYFMSITEFFHCRNTLCPTA